MCETYLTLFSIAAYFESIFILRSITPSFDIYLVTFFSVTVDARVAPDTDFAGYPATRYPAIFFAG